MNIFDSSPSHLLIPGMLYVTTQGISVRCDANKNIFLSEHSLVTYVGRGVHSSLEFITLLNTETICYVWVLWFDKNEGYLRQVS